MIPSQPVLEPDGLVTPTVGSWAAKKYRLVSMYAHMFTTSMHSKWGSLSYIDLYSGAGRAKVKPSRQLVLTTPTLALELAQPFDHYVFCESDPKKMAALKARVERDFPSSSPAFVEGDCNLTVEQVVGFLPTPSRTHTTLGFCVVDPFALQSFHFETIKMLSKRYMDFLVLIPAYMDAQRNKAMYLSKENPTVDNFLGTSAWRDAWSPAKGYKFGTFIADQFGSEMAKLNYTYEGLSDMVIVSHPTKNFPLYRLAFFSRNLLGLKFWRMAKRATAVQLPLFE